jgi:hypothetical protein
MNLFLSNDWLTSLTRPPSPATQLETVRIYVDDMLNSPTAPSNSDPAMAEFYGDAAVHLLSCIASVS